MHRKGRIHFDLISRDLKSSGASPSAPVVDGVCGDTNIANLLAAKFNDKLNKHSSGSRSTLLSSVQSSLSAADLSSLYVSEEIFAEAIFKQKPHKSDRYNVTTEHLKYASTVIAKPLSSLFTAILHHGYMPECFRDSIIVPIPKGNKDASKSSNYRPIALSSNFIKVAVKACDHDTTRYIKAYLIQTRSTDGNKLYIK